MVPHLVPEIEGGYPERDIGAEGQGWGDSRRLIQPNSVASGCLWDFPEEPIRQIRPRAVYHIPAIFLACFAQYFGPLVKKLVDLMHFVKNVVVEYVAKNTWNIVMHPHKTVRCHFQIWLPSGTFMHIYVLPQELGQTGTMTRPTFLLWADSIWSFKVLPGWSLACLDRRAQNEWYTYQDQR